MNAGGIGILARLIQMLLLSWVTSQKLITFVAKPSKEDLTVLQELMAAGKVTPVIDKRYSLSEVLRLSDIWKKGTLAEKQ